MNIKDIEFYGSPYSSHGLAELSIWICPHCGKEEREYRQIEAGDTLTCPHCDSTYYVEEG